MRIQTLPLGVGDMDMDIDIDIDMKLTPKLQALVANYPLLFGAVHR
jgi:hypothetical protein